MGNNGYLSRRNTLKSMTMGSVAAAVFPYGSGPLAAESRGMPSYLKGCESLWAQDPRKVNTEWFRNARLGMFMHYGINGVGGIHTWWMYGKYYDEKGNAQTRQPIPIAEFEKIGRERFAAEDYDADKITDLALEAGCRYVNITTRHHDGFCLWDSDSEPFNAMNMPNCKRDLVKELSDACDKKGLGFLPYWSLARDWRHPHAPPSCRPPYEEYFGKPDPHYAPAAEQDIEKYNAFAKQQITELFTKYKLAGIWFDGVGVGRPFKEQLRLAELYAFIRERWPHALISYKNGVVGNEDFLDAEGMLTGAGLYDRVFFDLVDHDVPREVCSNIGKSWAYCEAYKGEGKSPDAMWTLFNLTSAQHSNWLCNTGPMPNGSIDPAHAVSYRALGELIRKHGYPKHEGAVYEQNQDLYAQRLYNQIKRKGPMFQKVKLTGNEKESAALFFANHLLSLSLPPSRQDRRDVYLTRAKEVADAHCRTYAGSASCDIVREALAKGKDYEVKAISGKGLLYNDAETA